MMNKLEWIATVILGLFALFGIYQLFSNYCPSETECYLANYINESNSSTTQFDCNIVFSNLGKYYDGQGVQGSMYNIENTACSNETIEKLGIDSSKVKSCEYLCCWTDGTVKSIDAKGRCAYVNRQRLMIK
jgi:hypothetical protein